MNIEWYCLLSNWRGRDLFTFSKWFVGFFLLFLLEFLIRTTATKWKHHNTIKSLNIKLKINWIVILLLSLLELYSFWFWGGVNRINEDFFFKKKCATVTIITSTLFSIFSMWLKLLIINAAVLNDRIKNPTISNRLFFIMTIAIWLLLNNEFLGWQQVFF